LGIPIAAIGLGFLVGAMFNALSNLTQTATTYGKWYAHTREAKTGAIAEALQTILSAEKDEATGLSSKGTVDTIHDFIQSTLKFALITDEGIASQLFIQMIQQSIAYAIHSSHAGAIGTIGNVYSGSMYLSGTQASSIGENADYFDRYLRSFLSAEVGLNKPTLTFELVRGANDRIEEMYRAVMRDMDSFLDEWNDLALSYYRQHHTMCRERFADALKMKETLTERAYALLEQVANEHLARISEQLDTLEGAKAWFDGGLMSDTELADVSVRVNLERVASELNYDEYEADIVTAIGNGLTEWDAKITQAMGDLTDNEDRYNLMIRGMFTTMIQDVTDFAEMIVGLISDSISDVNAYRNMPVGVKVESQFTTVPYPKFELEVYVDCMNQIGEVPPPPKPLTCVIEAVCSTGIT